LSFVLADSPDGGGIEGPSDASEGHAFLLQRAKRKRSARTVAWAGDTSRLLEEVASEANLALALINVVRNKGAPGIDGQTVEEAEAQAPKLLPRLHRALLEGRYRPGDVRRVFIPKPGGGQRGLGIPNVIDRLVQQAVLQVLEPVFEPTFHTSSHGFRPKRGAMTAIAEAQEHLNAGYRTVVDLDLAQFFDRVHHQRLLDRIGQRVRGGISRVDGACDPLYVIAPDRERHFEAVWCREGQYDVGAAACSFRASSCRGEKPSASSHRDASPEWAWMLHAAKSSRAAECNQRAT
jgi:RNA-directed DNA polymerase